MAILDPLTVGRYAYGAGFRGETLAQMIAIAFGESTFNTNAVNSSSGATGLWQILPSAHPEFAGQDLKDPAVNARAAYSVFRSAPNAGQITKNKWSAYQGVKYWSAIAGAQAAGVAATAAGGLSSAAGAVKDTAGDVADVATAPLQAGVQAAQTASSAYNTITNPHNWLRIAYGVAGIALIYAAVISVSKGAIMNSEVTKLVVGATKKVVTKGKV